MDKQFVDWLMDNWYRKDIKGFYYSAINADNDGEKFTWQGLLNHYNKQKT